MIRNTYNSRLIEMFIIVASERCIHYNTKLILSRIPWELCGIPHELDK
jgi:hypothetical protein